MDDLKEKGNICFKNKDYNGAIKFYNDALQLECISNEDKCTLYKNSAQCLINLKKFKSAEESSRKALELDSGDYKAMYRLVQSLRGQNLYTEALELVRRLTQINKDSVVLKLASELHEEVRRIDLQDNNSISRVDQMFSILQKEKNNLDLMIKAFNNLSSLIVDDNGVANIIWNDSRRDKYLLEVLLRLKNEPDFFSREEKAKELLGAFQQLISLLIESNSDRGLYFYQFFGGVDQLILGLYYPNETVVKMYNKLLKSVVLSLSQIKIYLKAYHEYNVKSEKNHAQVGPFRPFPQHEIDLKFLKIIETLFEALLRIIDHRKLPAFGRDAAMLIWLHFLQSSDRSGISSLTKLFIKNEGIKKVLCAASSIRNYSLLNITPDTKMTGATLLAKFYDTLNSDKEREQCSEQINQFIVELVSDLSIESIVDSISALGVLFKGPYDLGAALLAREGMLDGILQVVKSENTTFQKIALETLIDATSKKDKCMSIVKMAVPILQELYKHSTKSELKIRSLVALCKIGSAGGSDFSIRTLAEGSCVNLAKCCLRYIHISVDANQSAISDHNLLNSVKSAEGLPNLDSLEEEKEEEEDDEVADTNEVDTDNDKKQTSEDSKTFNNLSNLSEEDKMQGARWALEGLCYLSFDGDVKELIVHGAGHTHTSQAFLKISEKFPSETLFALCTIIVNITNSYEKPEVMPELIELAKYSKQHIPEEHPNDSKPVLIKRIAALMSPLNQSQANSFLPYMLYKLFQIADQKLDSNHCRELLSSCYLTLAEYVNYRGSIVQSGGGKVLVKLSCKNSVRGTHLATQALAKIAITNDPRIAFPGQRALETIRPLCKLLRFDCKPIQNFESLMALTNLASLGDVYCNRILSEKALPDIEHFFFDEDVDLRRAATQCVCNLVICHKIRRHFQLGKNDRVKLLYLYCAEGLTQHTDEDGVQTLPDLDLVRAAGGSLAILTSPSYDDSEPETKNSEAINEVVDKITKIKNWVETMQLLIVHEVPEIQHCGNQILKNMLEYSRELCEYLILTPNCGILELLSAVAKMPQELTSLHPSRLKAKECAEESLKISQDYGFIRPA